MEHFGPCKTPACGQPLLLSAERKASSVGRSIHSTGESCQPGSDASPAVDLVLCHYPTARGTMRAFPDSRRRAWLLVMPVPGPVFVFLSGPDMFLDRTSSYHWPHYLPCSLRHRSGAAYLS